MTSIRTLVTDMDSYATQYDQPYATGECCYYDNEPAVYDMGTVVETDWGASYHRLRRASALM